MVRGNIYCSDNLFYSDPDKDAVAFVIILAVLIVIPSGLFGARGTERV